jgi:hypothetical protein
MSSAVLVGTARGAVHLRTLDTNFHPRTPQRGVPTNL